MVGPSTSAQSVLLTPLQIYGVAKENFSDVKVREVVTEGHEKKQMELSIGGLSKTILLSHAIMKNKFVEKVYACLASSSLSADQSSSVLDKDTFTLERRLKGWKAFRRKQYEEEGGNCLNLINRILNNAEDPETKRLGFLPSQVDPFVRDSDLTYFRNFASSIQNSPRKRILMNRLKQIYPNVYQHILSEHMKSLPATSREAREDGLYATYFRQLNERVIGQENATGLLAGLLASQQREPASRVFLFVGPSGVGKTELAKAVSEIKGDRFIRFDMNTHSGASSASDIFGSPAGYVGSTSPPAIAAELEKLHPVTIGRDGRTEIRQVNDAVLLFDELEKAGYETKQSLLRLLDEMTCRVQYTRKRENVSIEYRLRNSILIGTSNLFKGEIRDAFKTGLEAGEVAKLFKQLNEGSSILGKYPEELLNRMCVVPFNPIPRGHCFQSIIKKQLNESCIGFRRKFQFHEVILEHEAEILEALENHLYGTGDDLRGITNFFSKIELKIESCLSSWGDLQRIKLKLMLNDALEFCVQPWFRVDYFEDDAPKFAPIPIMKS